MFANRSPEFTRAFKLSVPVFFAYFPIGIVFAILFAHLGFSRPLGPVMSALVYGGSVQFVALSMMVNHAGFFAIIFATVFIALRNSFYGLSLLDRFQTHWALKFFLIFGLVDATYAALMTSPPREGENDIKFCFLLTFFIYLSWVMGTLVGAIISPWVPMFSGASFILPAFFMVLVVEYFLVSRSFLAIIAPIIAAIAAFFIMPKNYLLVAIVLSVLFILFIHNKVRNKQ